MYALATTLTDTPTHAARPVGLVGRLVTAMARRREAAVMAAMDARMLADIGLGPAERLTQPPQALSRRWIAA